MFHQVAHRDAPPDQIRFQRQFCRLAKQKVAGPRGGRPLRQILIRLKKLFGSCKEFEVETQPISAHDGPLISRVARKNEWGEPPYLSKQAVELTVPAKFADTDLD